MNGVIYFIMNINLLIMLGNWGLLEPYLFMGMHHETLVNTWNAHNPSVLLELHHNPPPPQGKGKGSRNCVRHRIGHCLSVRPDKPKRATCVIPYQIQWKRLSVDAPPATRVVKFLRPKVMSVRQAVRLLEHGQTDTRTDGSDSMTSTADAGGNEDRLQTDDLDTPSPCPLPDMLTAKPAHYINETYFQILSITIFRSRYFCWPVLVRRMSCHSLETQSVWLTITSSARCKITKSEMHVSTAGTLDWRLKVTGP